MKTLWCKNQENPSDRISHAWAPLNFLEKFNFLLYISLKWIPIQTGRTSCLGIRIRQNDANSTGSGSTTHKKARSGSDPKHYTNN
jgi:hypothetical protein